MNQNKIDWLNMGSMEDILLNGSLTGPFVMKTPPLRNNKTSLILDWKTGQKH